RWRLGNFRDAVGITDSNGNGIDDAEDIATGTSSDLNGNCRPDEGDRRLYVDVNASASGDGYSWASPRTDLGLALQRSALPCSGISEIWVADGVYLPDSGSGDRWARFNMRSDL